MTGTPGREPPKTPISPRATREDLVAMIHNRDALVSDLKEALASAPLAAKPAEDGKDASPFEGLTALVQYRRKDDGVTWHNMAAFDFFGPAERYRDKQDPEAPWEYRAVDLSTTGAPKP